VVPPPELQLRVVEVRESPWAVNPTGSGGGAWRVVTDTVTPEEILGVELEPTAQILKLYWVDPVSPVTTWLVPEMAEYWGDEQSEGAAAPAA
jgi:hypothetical protein